MPDRADAHIHLFRNGYGGQSFTARPGVRVDEAACYKSLAAQHGVDAALVVGYAGEPWCEGNNDFVAVTAEAHPWVKPVAFVDFKVPLSIDMLESLRRQRFIGLSFYVFGIESSE